MDERLRHLIRAVEESPGDKTVLEAALAECNRTQSLEGATRLARVTPYFFVVEVLEGFVLANMRHCRAGSGEERSDARVTILLGKELLNNNQQLMPQAWQSFRDSAWELPSLPILYSIMRELSFWPRDRSAVQNDIANQANGAFRNALSWGLITSTHVRYPERQSVPPNDVISHGENGRRIQEFASLSENTGVIHLEAAGYWNARAHALFGDTPQHAVEVFSRYNFETVELWIPHQRRNQEFPITIRGVISGPRLTLMSSALQGSHNPVFALGIRWL